MPSHTQNVGATLAVALSRSPRCGLAITRCDRPVAITLLRSPYFQENDPPVSPETVALVPGNFISQFQREFCLILSRHFKQEG
jgi:hypothetical protein